MKKILSCLIFAVTVQAFADGPVTQATPYMAGLLRAANAAEAQTALGLAGGTDGVALTVISNTALACFAAQTPYEPISYYVSNCFEWWDPAAVQSSDFSPLSSWTGKHGNVLQGSGVIWESRGCNGYPGMYFTGSSSVLSNQTMIAAGQFTNAGTLFIVYNSPWTTNRTGYQALLYTSTNNNALRFGIDAQYFTGSSFTYPFVFWQTGTGNEGDSFSADQHPGDSCHVLCVTWSSGSGGHYADFIDGKMAGEWPSGPTYTVAAGPPVPFQGAFYLGNAPGLPWALSGSFGDVILFTNALSYGQIDQVNNFLLNKYGLAARNVLCLIGDSMLYGGDASQGGSAVDYFSASLPGWSIADCAIPGASSSQDCWVISNSLAMTSCAANRKIAIVWNNLNNDGNVPSTTETNQIIMAALLASNGWQTILVDPPSNPTSDGAVRDAYTNWARLNWSKYFDGFVDLAASPLYGQDGQWTNGFYYAGNPGADNPHWTNAAWADAVPNWFVPAINQVISGTSFQSMTAGSLSFRGSTISAPNPAIQVDIGGYTALNINSPSQNTIMGVFGGRNVSTGSALSGLGYGVLAFETSGADETAVGNQALESVSGGQANTVVGSHAFADMTGGDNDTAVGKGACPFFGGSIDNETLIGYQAGLGIEGGTGGDIFLGSDSGASVTNGNNNIEIGNEGLPSDGDTIRIGSPGVQTNAFIYGLVQMTNGFACATNFNPVAWVPVSGMVKFEASNNWMYAITTLGTNRIFQISP